MGISRGRVKRILLKLSGEALMGDKPFGIDPAVLQYMASEVSSIHRLGVQIAIVIGGGNIFRGLKADEYGVGQVAADHMGMLATVMNAIAMGETLQRMGSDVRIMSAIDMVKIAEPYVRGRAMRHLSKDRVVIFGAGTGNPFFTTDTAAALRAMEMEVDILLKGTRVDGVFNDDPLVRPTAKLFKRLHYRDVLEKDLKVMDLTAVSLAMGRGLPIIVFNVTQKGNMMKVVSGEDVGTIITGEEP